MGKSGLVQLKPGAKIESLMWEPNRQVCSSRSLVLSSNLFTIQCKSKRDPFHRKKNNIMIMRWVSWHVMNTWGPRCVRCFSNKKKKKSQIIMEMTVTVAIFNHLNDYKKIFFFLTTIILNILTFSHIIIIFFFLNIYF